MCSSWKIYLLGITYYLLLTASVNLRRKYEQFLSYFLYGVFTQNETFCLFFMKKDRKFVTMVQRRSQLYASSICNLVDHLQPVLISNTNLVKYFAIFALYNLDQRFSLNMIYCLELCKYFEQFQLAMPLNILLLDRPLQNIFCKPKWWKLFYPPTKRGGHT